MGNVYIPWPDTREESIRIQVFNEAKPVNTHKHDFIEIVFMMQGKCVHSYHDTEVTLIPGDVFIVVPHEEHSYAIESRTVIYNCMFYPEVLGEDWDSMKKISGIYDFLIVEPFYRSEQKHQEILHLNRTQLSYIEEILNNMLDEQNNRPTGYKLIQKAYLTALLTYLGRIWDEQLHGDWDTYNNKRELLVEALNYIEANMENELKVNDLAARAYVSPHYFRKLFRQVTGLTPIDYINKLRISKATTLLKDKNLSISQISQIVGINDMNYFSRLFKTTTGISPSEFRKKNNIY